MPRMIGWFLWAIRGIRPLTDAHFEEWLRSDPTANVERSEAEEHRK